MALLLFSGGHTTQAATGVTDPTAVGTIRQMAVDLNTAGNNPGTGTTGGVVTLLGPIDSTISVPLNTTQQIDVIVDEINAADGNATGYGYDLNFNPAIVSINGYVNGPPPAVSPFMVSGGFYVVAPPSISFVSPWNDTYGTLGSGSHSGEGVLDRIGILCGNTIGSSTLTLTNGVIYTSISAVGDTTVPIVPNSLGPTATIYCGMAAPAGVDESIHSVTTSPASASAGVPFTVSDTATVTNATALGPVTNNVTQTLTMPADCTTSSTNPVTTAVSVPASGSNSVTTNWTVTCTAASDHTFSVTQSEAITGTAFFDTSAGNDTDTSTSATPISANADPAITGASTSSSAASQCLPQSPPAPGCASAPVVAIGSPQTITVTKTIANLSGFSNYSVQDTVVWVGAQEAPGGATPNSENPCTMLSPTVCQWSGGPAAIASDTTEYHSTCTVTPVGAAGVLGPASSSQTVGPLTSPQTVTFQFTATCTNNSFFDSHNPEQIALLFEDQITNTGLHITDTNPGNNTVVPIVLAFWNRNPNFNPAFTMTISSTEGPSDPNTIPSTHNCVTNQLVSATQAAPLPGLPCEMYQTTSIPAGNPLALPLVITPEHTATTKGFTISNGETTAPGTVVAYFGFSINLNFGTACTTTLGAPYPAVALKNGALPGGTTAGDPLTAPYPAQGPDTAGPAVLTNPAVWPTNLNSDPGVMAMVGMHAPIWARYTATDPVLGTAVNILVFNAGTSYYTLTVTGDPLGAPTPPGTQCTPFLTQTDYLGSVSPGGSVLRTCDDPSNGTNYVFVAQFTRADTFQSATVVDATNSCTASDTAITSMVKNETLGSVTVGSAGSPNAGVTYIETVTMTLQGSGPLTLSLVGPAVCNPHWVNPGGAVNNIIAGVQTSVVTIPSAGPGVVTATYSFNCPAGSYSFQIIANLTPQAGETNIANNQIENHVAVYVAPGCGENIPCPFSGTNVDTITTTACVMSGTTPVNCDATVAGTTTGGGIMVPNGPFTGTLHDDWTVYTASAPCAAVTGTLTGTGWSGTLNAGAFFCEVVAGTTYSFNGTITLNGTPGGALLVSMACTHTSGTTPATNVYTCTSTFSGGDQCPGVNDPESGGPDPSDTTPSNGCPDTNISVTAVKQENFNVDVSVDTQKSVAITVTNSEFPANVVVNITAISLVGTCEVRLTPHAGDTYSEYFTIEPAGNTLTSQVSFVIPNMPVGTQTFTYTYTIHCFQKSFHPAAFELQIDALPQAPVVEENLGGNPITDPTNPNNNVAKNFPNVTAWERANLAKGPCSITTNAVDPQGTGSFLITEDCTVTNLGPYGLPSGTVTYSDTVTPTFPADCTISGQVVPSGGTLTGSTPQHIITQYLVSCTAPSNHTFTINDTITLTGPIHVYDACTGAQGPVPSDPPCTNNNSNTSSVTVAIHTTTDPYVQAGSLNCSPSPANAGQTITCSESDIVGLGGSTGATLTSTLSVPADCKITSPNPVTQAATSGANADSWTLTCSSPSDHTFTKTVTLTAPLPLHVLESNTGNNSGNAGTTVAIIANGNLAVTLSPAPGESEVGQPPSTATINATATVTNSGDPVTVGWTLTINGTGTAPCVGESAHTGTGLMPAYTFSETLPAGPESHECTYQICVTAAASAVHETGTVNLCQQYSLQANVLVAKYCIDVGPAAVNLSDTNGRYMWVICEIGNVTSEPEPVTITSAATLVSGALPAGCTSTTGLILPGQTSFTLGAHEQKDIVYRVRYECHAPATGTVINQTVAFTVTHVNDAGTAADVETILSDNTQTTTRQVIIQ
jgi:hypothetical protein